MKKKGVLNFFKKDVKEDGQYWSSKHLLSMNADYSLAWGPRSKGKTTEMHLVGIREYINKGRAYIYLRRWDIEVTPTLCNRMFSNIEAFDGIKTSTNGKWDHVKIKTGSAYLARYIKVYNEKTEEYEDDEEVDTKPFCYILAINQCGHVKSTSYPDVGLVVFDEFIPLQAQYIKDEFSAFTNMISTIVRNRDDIKIVMLANSIDPHNLYFREFKLNDAKYMQPGDMQLFGFEGSVLKIACEFTAPPKEGRPSDKYFDFQNTKVSMITTGDWETNSWPHLPSKYYSQQIACSYYITFDNELFKCDIVETDDNIFTFCFPKYNYTPSDNELVFGCTTSTNPMRQLSFRSRYGKLPDKVFKILTTYPVFYSDNLTGDTINNFMKL